MSYLHGAIAVAISLLISYLGMKADEEKKSWLTTGLVVIYMAFIFCLGMRV